MQHYDRQLIGHSVLVTSPIWGPRPDCCYCQTVVGVLIWSPLLWKDRSVIYNCCWPLPAVILGTESRTTDDHYCLRFKTPPAWRARIPFLYPSGTGWPGYNPRHWVLFLSPPTTCRAMVEVLEPPSTWITGHNQLTLPQPELIYDWQFTSHQFILASSLLTIMTSFFFATERLRL
jgi:hypothetical protein